MIHNNDLIAGLARHLGGGIELMEQPVCEKCERVGTWDKGNTGYCHHCGHRTLKPITMGEFFIKYVEKELPPELLEAFGNASLELDIERKNENEIIIAR